MRLLGRSLAAEAGDSEGVAFGCACSAALHIGRAARDSISGPSPALTSMARQAAGKVAMVIAMVALLAGVAVFYQKMDGSRSSSASKEGSGKQDLGEGLKLQTQINDLKVMLKKLAMENSELKKAGAELKLRKQELQVCNSNLARLRKDKGKVENWATQVDDEKQAKSQKLKETRGKLENERVKSSELTQRVDAMQAKLSQTRGALKDIESQKEQSITKFREQKTKYSKLKQELATLKKSGEDKGRQNEIQRIIDEMNKDLRQKSSVIQELTKQKRASDDMLRRLEGKLMEAGVSPAEIDRATKPKATVKRESAPNPAAAALMQVCANNPRSWSFLCRAPCLCVCARWTDAARPAISCVSGWGRNGKQRSDGAG